MFLIGLKIVASDLQRRRHPIQVNVLNMTFAISDPTELGIASLDKAGKFAVEPLIIKLCYMSSQFEFVIKLFATWFA